jgi:hypothetical protein
MLAGQVLLEDALCGIGLAPGGTVVTSAAQRHDLAWACDAVRFHTACRFAVAHAGTVANVTGKSLLEVRVRQKIFRHFGVTVAAQLVDGLRGR